MAPGFGLQALGPSRRLEPRAESLEPGRLQVVLNWTDELKARVPPSR